MRSGIYTAIAVILFVAIWIFFFILDKVRICL